ncbi:hypothetical protein Goklo_029303, partial [Gossypium klotzschianum]|nr:hypothetical protein [Gossypium klotzschianum]
QEVDSEISNQLIGLTVYLSTENDTKGLYLFQNSHGEWVIPESALVVMCSGSVWEVPCSNQDLAGLVDKWNVSVKEVMGSSLWDDKGCIFAPNFGNSCAELGF